MVHATPAPDVPLDDLAMEPPAGCIGLLSDLHLNVMSEEKMARLEKTVALFSEAKAVYFVGDLADNLHRPEAREALEETARPFLEAVQSLADAGVKLTYVPGNHDYGCREQGLDWEAFPVACTGAEVPVLRTELGRTVRFTHGDEYDPIQQSGNPKGIVNAARGPLLGKILAGFLEGERHFFATVGKAAAALEALLPDLGEYLAWKARLTEVPLPNPLFYYPRWELAALEFIRRDSLDAVVMGHTHGPRVKAFDQGIYLNTGDWHQHAAVSWFTEEGAYQQDLSRRDLIHEAAWPTPA